MKPDEVMRSRWLNTLQKSGVPEVDLDDVNALLDDPQAGRQFAAEYSQDSYTQMLGQDCAIGDYIAKFKTMPSLASFSYQDRERLVSIIQDLSKKKEYKQETMHLAANLADRYLSISIQQGKSVPNLFCLGATVMLMAAKLEQPISPSFNRMIRLLPKSQQLQVEKQDLIDLEEQIMKALDFDFAYASPISFLERYQRLLSVD